MTENHNSNDARAVLEKIRREHFEGKVTAEMLKAVFDVEHAKQFEDDRTTAEALIRKLIVDAVTGEAAS